MKDKVRYIFVGGCGRSGTTLVQKILCGHSLISGGPELGFTKDFFDLFSRVQNIYNQGLLNEYFLEEKDFKNSFHVFFDSLLKNQVKENIEFISEKTPSNIFVCAPILALFESAYFVNVIRDGRDVVASHLKVKERYRAKGKLSPFNIISVCRLWNNSVDEFKKSSQNPEFSNRIFNVRYEELIQNPKYVLDELFAFLSLNLEEHLLYPEKLDFKKVANVNDIWYTNEMARQSFNTSNIGKWTNMPFWKKILVQILMAKNLKEMGYEVSKVYLSFNSVLSFFKIYNMRKWKIYKMYLKLRYRYT